MSRLLLLCPLYLNVGSVPGHGDQMGEESTVRRDRVTVLLRTHMPFRAREGSSEDQAL